MKLKVCEIQDYNTVAISKAVDEIFDEFELATKIKRGSKVFIKPNLIRDVPPEKAATTHPTIVSAVAKKLVDEYDCKVTVGDSSGGVYSANYINTVYRITKMDEACASSGATLNNDFGSRNVNINGNTINSVDITDAFLNADVVINIAKLKTHCFAGYSGAVKNLFGLIPGLVKVELHSRFPHLDEFCNFLIDLNEFASKKIVLHMIDGIVGMEGEGPTNGTPRAIGKLIVSDNAYFADVAAISVFAEPNDMVFARIAVGRGKITQAMLDDETVADVARHRIKDYHVVPVADNRQLVNMPKWLQKIFKNVITQKARINHAKCKGCGKCKTHCPQKAITIVNHKATINQRKCIRCYCCQELCAYNAVVLKRPFVAKIVKKFSSIDKKTK